MVEESTTNTPGTAPAINRLCLTRSLPADLPPGALSPSLWFLRRFPGCAHLGSPFLEQRQCDREGHATLLPLALNEDFFAGIL